METFFKVIKANLLVLCSAIIVAGIFILIKADIYAKNSIETGVTVDEPTDIQTIEIETEIQTEAETVEITEIVYIETTEEIEAMTTTEEIKETETLEELETAVDVLTTQPPVNLVSKNVPVLMYHTSSENNPGGLTELYVKPSEFEKQVQYLIENGFTFCTFDDYNNLNNIDKPIFITFDDGYKENYTEIFPILQKYEAKITLFLIINSITDSNITKDMIVEMSDSGLVKFESHTNTHASLVAISSDEARLTNELQNSKIKIEEITGKPVLALCYPNGEFNGIVKNKAKKFYSFGLRKDLGMHNTDYDPFEVRRIRINRSTSIETFKSLVG